MRRTYFDPTKLQFRTRVSVKAGRMQPFSSRRFPNGGAGQANLSDGDPDPNADPARVKLLGDIQKQFITELESRGYKSEKEVKEEIAKEFQARFKDMNIEALRAYEANKDKMELAVRGLALELEKLKNVSAEAKQIRNALQTAILDGETIKLMERAFTTKNAADAVTIDIKSRALHVPMTTGNTVDNSAVPIDILNSFSVGEYVKKRQPREWIFDIASRRTVGEVTKYKIWLDEGNVDGGFAIVAEGAVKPYVSGTLVRNYAEAKKVAAKYVITEELQKFMADILNIVEDLIRDKLLRDYNQLLAVDLLAEAASYVGTTLDGQYENPTDYHVIAAVSAQIATLEFQPSVLIIHPQDKYRILLEQATDGHFYVNIPVINPAGELSILGLRVRTSTQIPLGTGIIGEEGLWKIEDEAISIRVGYGIEVTKDGGGVNVINVTSDLDTNRMRMIIETWFINWISSANVGSFVEFDFEDVKAVLQKP